MVTEFKRNSEEGKEMESNSGNIDMAVCPSCGEGNEKGNSILCPLRESTSEEKEESGSGIDISSLEQSVSSLAGAIVFFWMGGLESKLVGKVNGEGITRKEFSKRLERVKKFYELRYGQNLFQGEEGKENLNRLKTDILDEMTTEKILLQEAKSAGYSFST